MVGVGWKNRRKRRNRLGIMAEMLEIAKKGALKTHIMYRANLSFAQLNEYLSFLLETGLLEAVHKSQKALYKTTEKGFHYLQGLNNITALLSK